MSNRKKWSKTIKFTHLFRKDKLFKSYWVRKFLNKISIISKSYKTEKFLFNCLHTIKKLQVSNYHKQRQSNVNRLLNKKLGLTLKFTKFFKHKKSIISKFKKLKFRKIKYQSYILKKNIDSNSKKNVSLNFKNFKNYKEQIYFINNNKNLKNYRVFSKNTKLSLSDNFLVFNKNQISLYSPSANKVFREALEERKHVPISYILRMIDYSRWIFTTQLRRLGKYFHNIPTVITFPRTHNFGIKKLAFALKFSKKFNNFQQKFSVEILNILFRPRKSYSRRLRRQKFKIVKKNAPYANFRWK